MKDFIMQATVTFFGVVEDINDPLKAGRVRVRCFGYHTDDKMQLPTEHLPWAQMVQPVTSAATQDVGTSATGIRQGSWVLGMFIDGTAAQNPLVIGTIAGLPQEFANTFKGFNDPQGVYPQRVGKPDTNRRARNDSDDPHPLSKTPVTNSLFTEQQATFNAVYPNNHVTQTPGGHIKEFDDSDGAKRIHEYHAAGTYTEIDNSGDRVVHVVGDGFDVTIGSKNVHVGGTCNLYVEGEVNVQCDSASINASGSINFNVGGTFNVVANPAIINGFVIG